MQRIDDAFDAEDQQGRIPVAIVLVARHGKVAYFKPFGFQDREHALENVVETARAATEALAETKKLGLKTDVAKRLPIGVGDEQRLTQVLLNLVEFTDSGEVCITATASKGHFALSV